MATEGASTPKSIDDTLNDARKAAVQVKENKAKGEDSSEAEGRLLEAVNALARERDALQAFEQPPAEADEGLTEDQVEWLQRVKRLAEREMRNNNGEPRGQAFLEEVMKAPSYSKAAKEG